MLKEDAGKRKHTTYRFGRNQKAIDWILNIFKYMFKPKLIILFTWNDIQTKKNMNKLYSIHHSFTNGQDLSFCPEKNYF